MSAEQQQTVGRHGYAATIEELHHYDTKAKDIAKLGTFFALQSQKLQYPRSTVTLYNSGAIHAPIDSSATANFIMRLSTGMPIVVVLLPLLFVGTSCA